MASCKGLETEGRYGKEHGKGTYDYDCTDEHSGSPGRISGTLPYLGFMLHKSQTGSALWLL